MNTVQDDNLSNPNVCSLREAIIAANTNAAVNGCTAGSSAETDVIRLNTNLLTLPATMTLTAALPAVSADLAVEGPGAAGWTVDGAGHRIFDVAGNATTLTLTGMTLTGANIAVRVADGTLLLENMALAANTADDGAAVYNSDGKVTVRNSVFSGNRASSGNGGAVASLQGTLNFFDSSFTGNGASGNGGAVYAEESALTATRLNLDANTAARGGALNSYRGTLRVSDSTFSRNGAQSGGAIHLDRLASNVNITNTTFSANTASVSGSVLLNIGSPVLMTLCTVSDASDGAIATVNSSSAPSVTFRNTLVAGGANACSGAIFSLGNNLDQGTGCGFNQAGDLSGTAALLSPILAVQGGTTPTLLPGVGSPAIDAGDCSAGLTRDQRGFDRPQNADCDIGAVEIACGNSVVEAAEACDDGNTAAGDGCSDACQIEAAPDPDPTPTPPPPPGPTPPSSGSSGGGCSLQLPRR